MKRAILFLSAVFLVLFAAIVFQIINNEYSKARKYINENNSKILTDISYTKGQWNTNKYVNDTQIDATYPYYIFTKNGFIIDRNEAIRGYLDSASFLYSSSFLKPQTVVTEANEIWRLYSVSISNHDKTLGTVIVGYYNPEMDAIKQIDNQLVNNAKKILSMLIINQDNIGAEKVESRNIDIEVSYEIINIQNQLIKGEGGIPSYIDPSYLANNLTSKEEIINVKKPDLAFLVRSLPIVSNNAIVGVIVGAYPLSLIYSAITKQILIILFTSLFLLLLGGFFIKLYIQKLTLKEKMYSSIPLLRGREILWFDKEECVIYFKNQKIPIPSNTHLHRICKIMFSNPNKKWKYDDIAQGGFNAMYDEVKKYRRTIYDAVEAINLKSKRAWGFDVIEYKLDTYRIAHKFPQKS